MRALSQSSCACRCGGLPVMDAAELRHASLGADKAMTRLLKAQHRHETRAAVARRLKAALALLRR